MVKINRYPITISKLQMPIAGAGISAVCLFASDCFFKSDHSSLISSEISFDIF